jgi:enoyl-CoA hydratase/carnithine racemase
MATTYEQIRTERRDRVLLVTLHRPEKLNAWTPKMMAELASAITEANGDPDLGAVVVTGEGRGFCAGADIGAVFGGHVDDPAEAPADEDQPLATDWTVFCRSSKPLVAAINGPAIGVGLTMVLPFDQLLAAEGAKLSMRFVKLGLVPELASTHFLVSRCGWGSASWLALSGDTVSGDEALRLGLVDRLCAPDALVDEAVAMAAVLAANPPTAVRQIKDLLTANGTDTDLAAVQARELTALSAAYASDDHKAAVRAFLDRGR